ncbi:tautomerase family protein [Azonexus sp. IMCC34839]|uniref:tautomerase family protein n=1 Tax=Azonexus sp. IMCC34839 TaxID=3133695 RepID=UPI00399C0B57
MPLIQIAIAGPTPVPATVSRLQAETTTLMRDILRKQAPLTVVAISQLPEGSLSANGQGVPLGAFLEATVTAGTNTDDEKAAFIVAAEAMLRDALGRLDAPVYVIVQEIPATDWGYDGRTQAARRIDVAGVTP